MPSITKLVYSGGNMDVTPLGTESDTFRFQLDDDDPLTYLDVTMENGRLEIRSMGSISDSLWVKPIVANVIQVGIGTPR